MTARPTKRIRGWRTAAVGLVGAVGLTMAVGERAEARDRHAGYYYPQVSSNEIYCARAPVLRDSDEQRRLGFVIGLTQEAVTRPYPPPVAMFTKGATQEKLIIVALNDSAITTLFQARAFLAQLTALSRTSDIFVQNGVEDYFTFLDLLRLMGFERLTISDGENYAHQFDIVAPSHEACAVAASLPRD